MSKYWAVISVVWLITGCFREEDTDYAVVFTDKSVYVSKEYIGIQGKLINPSGAEIVEMGFTLRTDRENQESAIKYPLKEPIIKGVFTGELYPLLKPNETYYVNTYAIFFNKTIYGKEVGFLSDGSQIGFEGFYPSTGVWGDTIELKGNRFGTRKQDVTVYFGDVQAWPMAVSDSVILVKVPNLLNQVSTHISITVLGNTVRSTSPFTIPPPEILTLVPSEVFINASIGITGKHFNKDYTKLFLDTSATAPSPNAMSIPLTTITTSSLSFILREQNYAKLYLYVSVLDQIVRANTPIIYKSLILNDYYPDKATFGDTLTLTGTNFDIGAIDVTFGGYFGNVKQMPLSVTKDTIKVSVPGGLLKDWNYISVLQNGTNYIYPKIFRITPPEIQNVVNPNFTWGDTVTIQGKGFNGVMKEKNVVYLGNISISPVDATNNMLKFIVPDNHLVTSSSVYMNVVGLNSNVFSPVNLLPVEITSLSVSSVGFGEQMIIMGKNFHPNTAYNKVTFASQAPFTVISGNTNSLTVALENCVAGMPGIGTVTVKISGQTSTSTSPITIAASQINDVAPLKVKPGDTITITGSNLEGSNICSEITMGGVPLTYLSGDNTTLTAIVPRIPEGFYPVNVNVLGQTASSVQNVEVFHIWAEQTQLGTITGYQGYFSHLDKGYIMQRISTNTSTLIQFDPVAGSWSNFMEINTPSGYSSGTFVSLGSFGWMLSADTLHRFDPAAKEWLMWDIFPGQNEDLIVGFGIGDKLYFTGGRHYNNGFIYDSAMWIFNTVDNTWSETAGIKCYLSTGFSTGGKGYVAWGDLNTIWEYDPVANNWISLPYTYPPADNKRSWPATAEVSGKVYIGGGNRVIHIGDNTSPDVFEFDPLNGIYRKVAEMPVNQDAPGYFGFGIDNRAFFGIYWGLVELYELLVPKIP